MAKNHPGKQFMLGAMIGSTLGAISAMVFTTKKGRSLKKHAMEKLHEFEKYLTHTVQKNKGPVKRLVQRGKRNVEKTLKAVHKAAKRKKS